MDKENFYITVKSYETIEEFIESIDRGAEVGFEYKGKAYFIDALRPKYSIAECNNEKSEVILEKINDLLEYKIQGDSLKDIILSAKITWRNT